MSNTLYVIFHGTLAFYEDPGLPWIEAFVIDLKDDHAYLCGKFLGETRIPRGSHMTLVGVTPGKDLFSKNPDFVHFTPAKVNLDNVYSRFTFPRPKQIHHAFNLTTENGQPPGPGKAAKLCIVPVFEYDCASIDNVGLRLFLNYAEACAPDDSKYPSPRSDTFNWAPRVEDLPKRADGSIPPYTLHVIAEEDYDDPVNAIRDFSSAGQTLGDTQTNRAVYTHVDGRPDALPGMDGRTDWEINLPLRKRVSWLSTNVGQIIQQNPPTFGSNFSIEAPDSTRGDATCGPIIGGPIPPGPR